MIGDTIFVTDGTWHYLKDALDTEDRGKFQVIDMEKCGLFGEDEVFSCEYWRDETE